MTLTFTCDVDDCDWIGGDLHTHRGMAHWTTRLPPVAKRLPAVGDYAVWTDVDSDHATQGTVLSVDQAVDEETGETRTLVLLLVRNPRPLHRKVVDAAELTFQAGMGATIGAAVSSIVEHLAYDRSQRGVRTLTDSDRQWIADAYRLARLGQS